MESCDLTQSIDNNNKWCSKKIQMEKPFHTSLSTEQHAIAIHCFCTARMRQWHALQDGLRNNKRGAGGVISKSLTAIDQPAGKASMLLPGRSHITHVQIWASLHPPGASQSQTV